jgi:AraC-like DNA-binding protein
MAALDNMDPRKYAEVLEQLRTSSASEAIKNIFEGNLKIPGFSEVLQGDYDLSGSRTLRLVPLFSPSALARRSYFYLQGLLAVDFPSSHYTKRTGVDSYLMALTFSGKGELEYEGKSYTLEPDEGFIIDCKKPHYYYAASHSGWGYHIIHFDGYAMGDYYSQIKHSNSVKFAFPHESPFFSFFEQLYAVNNQRSRQSEMLTSCIIANMITEIMKTLSTFDIENAPEKLKDIRDYFDEHYSEDINLDGLASLFSVSKYHLCREFKKYMGQSPNKYLITSRINNAKAMLHFTDMRIADIAQAVGFADNTHFFQIFREYENTSPAEYRRKWKTFST